ncbi:carotenoid oxygenase family protein [Actinomadura kijaniata]|uniref:carotenoid oxygenase family protein n=1 Tax=Actinomadura kijaniata TaxID=46161 RepID=UPI000833C2F8|nr:carotenoid oxygenase family protein [Actinomadura kijaniata]
MTSTVPDSGPRTSLAAAPPRRSPADGPFDVVGALPDALNGCYAQAVSHPTVPGSHGDMLAGPPLLAGVRIAAGGARWLRGRFPVTRSRPLAPVPALAPAIWPRHPRDDDPDAPAPAAFARPARAADAPAWHTVATCPGLDHAEHLVVGPDGTVLSAEPFPLDGAPLVCMVAATRDHLVIFDSGAAHSPAAALIGARAGETARPGRAPRLGVLRHDHAGRHAPRWIDVPRRTVVEVVNAYDDGRHIVVDVVTRGPSRVTRWRLDPADGLLVGERAVGAATAAAVDPRVSGRRHRHLFATRNEGGATVRCHDLAGGGERVAALGPGWRVGAPVFAPDPRRPDMEGAGWIVAVARHPGQARWELRVFDALDPARSPAAVRLPAPLDADLSRTWIPAPDSPNHGEEPGGELTFDFETWSRRV